MTEWSFHPYMTLGKLLPILCLHFPIRQMAVYCQMHVEGNRGHTGSLVVNFAPQPSYVCDLGQIIQLLGASTSSSVQWENNSLYGIKWSHMYFPYSAECLTYSKYLIDAGDYSGDYTQGLGCPFNHLWVPGA